jgi:hypothetical protein
MTPEEFWSILHAVPGPVEPIRRLYYNKDGEPLFYAAEDLPGNYIDVDQETFARASSRVRVRNGQIVSTATHRLSKKLVPSEHGTTCDIRDVCVVVSAEQPHTKWTIKNYEQN